MTESIANADEQELQRFNALASRWWDPEGDFAPLHRMNPLRLGYVRDRAGPLKGLRIADIGCGGGLFSEALTGDGARVTGADLADAALSVARLHLLESGLEVEYLLSSAEALAAERPGAYDVVTCMEMLEHVPEPGAVVRACRELVRPGGHVFFSTLNRNLKSFLMAIVGAEYVLRLLPRGTHEYARFIRPSELDAWARGAGLRLEHLTGLHFNPMDGSCSLGGNVDVNYLVHFRRPPETGQ